jgi:hypothetical protein
VAEPVRRSRLVDARGVQVGGLLGDYQARAQLRRCADPADPQAGSDRLGERRKGQRAVIGAGESRNRRQRDSAVAKLAVWVVLDDPQPMACGQAGDPLAASHGKRATGRILKARDQIPRFRTVRDQRRLQRIWIDSLVVAGNADRPRTRQAEALQRGKVGGLLGADDSRRPSASNSSGAGRPPAKEITPSCSVRARMSRIGEERTPRSRSATSG